VRQVVPATTDTWLYDGTAAEGSGGSPFHDLQDVDDVSGGAVSLTSTRAYAPLSWPSTHTRTTLSVDAFGNESSATDGGIVGTDTAIQKSWIWQPADGEWIWRATKATTSYVGGTDVREYDFKYNAAGQTVSVTGNLSGTLPVRQDPSLAPLNASPSSNAAMLLATMAYDPTYGNLNYQIAGAQERVVGYAYDSAYHQLLTEIAAYPNGLQSAALTTLIAYNRGFETPTRVTDSRGGLTTASYDVFGRILSVQLPDTLVPGLSDADSGMVVTYTDVVGGPYQRIDLEQTLGVVVEGNVFVRETSRRTAMTNALGGVAAILSTGGAQDPAGSFIVSGMNVRDARGGEVKAYDSFFGALPSGATLPTIPAGTLAATFTYDSFERLKKAMDFDGSLLAEHVYHSLSRDTYDALDAVAASSGPTYGTLSLDGHGRLIQSEQRTQNGGGISGGTADTLKTAMTYLATGEPTSITRSSTTQGSLYTRWMQYDSLGRLVLNAEPNTSTGFVPAPSAGGTVPAGLQAWTYAYDAIGQLVGTEDARGCGINFTYDGVGRETSQDYIPCTAEQPAHTPVNLATGAGAEVFNIYDAPEANELAANSGGAAAEGFLAGSLAATYSRGEHTQYAYDGRGRATTVSRQMPNPPGLLSFVGEAPPTPYAPTWYQESVAYDEAGRIVAQSTGATLPGLSGASVSAAVPAAAAQSVVTVAYDARNIPTLVSGSYGVLAQNEQHDTNGHLTKRSYGDLANTTAAYSYDAKHRLTSASVTRAAAPPLWSTSVPGYSAPSGPLGSSLTTPLTLESLAFRYDAVSNPVAIFDSRSPSEWPDNAGPLSATLGYDDLYRLTSTAYAPAPFSSDVQSPPFYSTDPPPIAFVTPATRVKSQTFGYDATGNVTSSSDDQNALLQRSAGSATYGAPNSGGVTGPNQIAQGESPGGAYVTTYDASGNLTSLAATVPSASGGHLIVTLTYEWDEAGHLQQAGRSESTIAPLLGTDTPLPAVTNEYLYDGHGGRTWHSSNNPGTTEYTLDVFPSLRVGGTYWDDDVYEDYDLTYSTEQVYLVAGGASYGRLIRDDTLPSPSKQALHTFLEITDPQGSTSSVIDKETGELVEQVTYLANGQTETDYRPERWNGFREGYRYTGKQDDYEVGLVYFGARYFVPGLNRWASPDPLTIHGLGSDLNPYSFVGGSPFRFVDPVGLDEGGGRVKRGERRHRPLRRRWRWRIDRPQRRRVDFASRPRGQPRTRVSAADGPPGDVGATVQRGRTRFWRPEWLQRPRARNRLRSGGDRVLAPHSKCAVVGVPKQTWLHGPGGEPVHTADPVLQDRAVRLLQSHGGNACGRCRGGRGDSRGGPRDGDVPGALSLQGHPPGGQDAEGRTARHFRQWQGVWRRGDPPPPGGGRHPRCEAGRDRPRATSQGAAKAQGRARASALWGTGQAASHRGVASGMAREAGPRRSRLAPRGSPHSRRDRDRQRVGGGDRAHEVQAREGPLGVAQRREPSGRAHRQRALRHQGQIRKWPDRSQQRAHPRFRQGRILSRRGGRVLAPDADKAVAHDGDKNRSPSRRDHEPPGRHADRGGDAPRRRGVPRGLPWTLRARCRA
jgi:RHS repeat-associated protein